MDEFGEEDAAVVGHHEKLLEFAGEAGGDLFLEVRFLFGNGGGGGSEGDGEEERGVGCVGGSVEEAEDGRIAQDHGDHGSAAISS